MTGLCAFPQLDGGMFRVVYLSKICRDGLSRWDVPERYCRMHNRIEEFETRAWLDDALCMCLGGDK